MNDRVMQFRVGVMVLATAISSSAVKVAEEMICLSSKMLAKIIMIRALVWSNQPITEASPSGHLKILPAKRTPSNLPATEASNNIAAATNTKVPPIAQFVFSPVLKKNTGIMTNSTCLRSRSICV